MLVNHLKLHLVVLEQCKVIPKSNEREDTMFNFTGINNPNGVWRRDEIKAIPNRLLCGRVLPTKFELGYEPMRTKICKHYSGVKEKT